MEHDDAVALNRRIGAKIGRLLAECTPAQLAALAHGAASLALVPVDGHAKPVESPARCSCPCSHIGGCLTCGCTCEAGNPDVCPCCGADDTTITKEQR